VSQAQQVDDRAERTFGEEIVACEQAGITVYLPKPMISGSSPKAASVSRTLSISLRTMSIFVPPVSS
jgi:hypothetical protein